MTASDRSRSEVSSRALGRPDPGARFALPRSRVGQTWDVPSPIHPEGRSLSRGRGLFPCALAALSPVLFADGKSGVAPAADAPVKAAEGGVAALFAWGDADGDGRLDLAAVSLEGGLQLLTSTGDGRFEDVTEEV